MPAISPKTILWLALAFVLSALSGCDDDDDTSAGAGAALPTVVVAEVAQRDIRDSERFIGRVEPLDSVDLQARVEGFLDVRAARDGQSVAQGETLFVIEPAPYEADLARARAAQAEAQAAMALAQIELDRKTELLARATIPKAEYDIAVANHQAAQARIAAADAQARQAEIRLGYTEIAAPFDGRLGRIAHSEGDVVGPAAGPLANLTRVSPIYVSFGLSERDLVTILQAVGTAGGRIDPAARTIVDVELPNGTDLPEEGQLVFFDNRVDPATGTIALRARFDNVDGFLVPGAFVNVRIGNRDLKPRDVIPQAALQQDQQGQFVLVVGEDGLVEQRYVTLGATSGTDVVVTGGLATGEQVIVEGLQRVRRGQPVEAVSARDIPEPSAATAPSSAPTDGATSDTAGD